MHATELINAQITVLKVNFVIAGEMFVIATLKRIFSQLE
jgi:hypothetical protein